MEPLIDKTMHVEVLPPKYGIPGFIIGEIDSYVNVRGIPITCGFVVYETGGVMEAMPSICVWTKKKPVKLRIVS